MRRFGERPDIALFHGSAEEYRQRARKSYLTAIHRLKVILYHRGQVATEPWKIMPKLAEPSPSHPRMLAVIDRYLLARSSTSRPATIQRLEVSFRRFMRWLSQTHSQIESFAEVTRDHLFEFAQALNSWKGAHSGEPLSTLTKRDNLSCLSVFFRDVASWEWEDVPGRPLLGVGDGLTPFEQLSGPLFSDKLASPSGDACASFPAVRAFHHSESRFQIPFPKMS